MGEVYLAEQRIPIQRRVALKMIKPGMDTAQVIARFESERQALALMDHPNIAKVFDAGEHAGRPYFVMEYVAGIPITDYCDRYRLSTRERLGLFVTVCHAIQHAHQKGIVHRDIKPSNVLVGLQDGQPVPKVIDFGVAKAIGQRLTEKTLFTQHGLLIGTLEYMSPEQAEMTGLDVDTRTDVYSLGVMLYELLTGVLPFAWETFRKAAYDEIRRIIREEDPETPAARLRSLGDDAREIARRRRTDLSSLGRQIAGDLEWIVLTALEKDRTRRYPTTSELAADIDRYLEHEPVSVGPPSRAYRLRKFVRRYRGPVTAVAAVALTVLLLGSTALWFALRARQSALELRASSIMTAAAAAEDPLVRALLLLELGELPEPVGARLAVRRVLDEAVPANVFRGHGAPVTHVEFGPDNVLVSASEDGSVRVSRMDGRSETTVARSDAATPTFASSSPDGRRVASIWDDGVLRVDSVSGDGRVLGSVREEGSGLFGLGATQLPEFATFTPDGRRVVTSVPSWALVPEEWHTVAGRVAGWPFHGLRVWEADATTSVQLPEAVSTIDFNPVGTQVVVGRLDGTVEFWPSLGSAPSVVFSAHEGSVSSVRFDPTGTRLVTASASDGTFRLWEVDGTPSGTYRHYGAIDAKFSPNGRFVLAGTGIDSESYITLAPSTLETGFNVAFGLQPDDVRWASLLNLRTVTGSVRLRGNLGWFSADSSRVVTLAEDGLRLYKVDWPLVTVIRSVSVPASDVSSVQFARQGALVATAIGPDVHVYRVDVSPEPEYGEPSEGVEAVDTSADGTVVVTGSRDDTVRLWAADGTPLRGFVEPPVPSNGSTELISTSAADVLDAELSPDGQLVVSALAGGTAVVRSAGGGGAVRQLLGHESSINSATFSPDGRSILTASNDQTARIWSLDDGRETRVLRGHDGGIDDAGFSSDGSRVVTASREDRSVRVWAVDDGRELAQIRPARCRPTSVESSPDGTRVLVGCVEGRVMLWPASSVGEPVELYGAPEEVESVRFSPDGGMVVSAGAGVTVWNVDRPEDPINVSSERARSAVFTPGGNLLVAGPTTRLLTLDWSDLLGLLRRQTTACLTPEQRVQYLAETLETARDAFADCEVGQRREP